MKRRKFFKTFAKAAVIALTAPEIVRSAMAVKPVVWLLVLSEHQMRILEGLEGNELLHFHWGRRDRHYVKYMELLHKANPHYAPFVDATH